MTDLPKFQQKMQMKNCMIFLIIIFFLLFIIIFCRMVLANYDGSRVDVAGIATEFESRIKSIGQENREGGLISSIINILLYNYLFNIYTVVILTENITNTLIEAQSLLNDEK